MPPRLERMIEWNVPECINSQCDNNGCLTVAGRDGEPEQEQCEYCHRERLPLQKLILAAWNAALEAVREGVPEAKVLDQEDGVPRWSHMRDMWGEKYAEKVNRANTAHNTCRTAVTDHINSLGV